MSRKEAFFTFSTADDEVIIEHVAQDPLRKKSMNVRLNYKEAGLFLCWHIIKQAREGKTIREIKESTRKLLKADDVMLGVPEIMEELRVSVRFKDGKSRKVVVPNPVERGPY